MSKRHRRAIKAWVERRKLRPGDWRAAVRLANLDVSAVPSDVDVGELVRRALRVLPPAPRWRYSERVEGVPGGVMSFGDGL